MQYLKNNFCVWKNLLAGHVVLASHVSSVVDVKRNESTGLLAQPKEL